MKTCTNPECQRENPQHLNEFTRNKTNDCMRRYYRNYNKNWSKTDAGKASIRRNKQKYRKSKAYEREKAKTRDRWENDPEYREKEIQRSRKWRKSESGQVYLEKTKASRQRYQSQYRTKYYGSEAYNKSVKKYQQSDKWKKMAQKRDADRRARLAEAEGSFTQDEWEALCAKHDYKCLSCGKKRKLTVDHIKPLSRDGSNYIGNIQPLCKSCNSSKGDKTIDYRY